MTQLFRTHLYEEHVKLGGKIVRVFFLHTNAWLFCVAKSCTDKNTQSSLKYNDYSACPKSPSYIQDIERVSQASKQAYPKILVGYL